MMNSTIAFIVIILRHDCSFTEEALASSLPGATPPSISTVPIYSEYTHTHTHTHTKGRKEGGREVITSLWNKIVMQRTVLVQHTLYFNGVGT